MFSAGERLSLLVGMQYDLVRFDVARFEELQRVFCACERKAMADVALRVYGAARDELRYRLLAHVVDRYLQPSGEQPRRDGLAENAEAYDTDSHRDRDKSPKDSPRKGIA